jgi:NADH-quinone oxidoreductase subunit L
MTPNPNLYLWLIPLLSLTGAAVNGFFGKRFSKKAVAGVALFFSGAAFVMALRVLASFSSLTIHPYVKPGISWIRAGDFHVNFAFYLDELSLLMLMVVTGVGFLIHIYSVGYMWDDDGFYRFFSYLNLFMFFMLMLILANNYLVMFIGWEGVGLASYLLIGFYFLKDSAAAAGKKAFITNRIGDFGFLIALFLMIQHFGSLDYQTVAAHVALLPHEVAGAGVLTAIGILLMVGAAGKSAQIPLYVWLPDAMEGPTPVSALIHAATMVTAGVYMVSRSHVIFDKAPTALLVVAIVGTLTALFAATIGIAQTDIKKVLAYSTVSQLGYMFMACGVAAYSAGVFHLMTHAFFKGLLFLGSGSVIHALSGEQDMRRMGGLWKKIPWTFGTMLCGTVAIAGIPPFAGFWSKDEILWLAYSQGPHKIIWALGLLTAFITSFYMFRLLIMTFFGEYRGNLESGDHQHDSHGHDSGHGHGHGGIHESPALMLVPLVILAGFSLFGGAINVPKFLAPVFQTEASAPGAESHAIAASEESSDKTTERKLQAASVGVAFLGLILAGLLYWKSPHLPGQIADSLGGLYRTVSNKYYVDEIYNWALIAPLIAISRNWLWKGVDQGFIDTVINDSADATADAGGMLRRMQSGNLRSYAAWLTAGGAVVLAYMVWLGVH